MINICDISGNILYSTPINVGSKGRYQLMKEECIVLKLSLATSLYFPLGAYVDDPVLGLFEIVDEQKPTYNTATGGYDYSLRLDAHYWKWKNKIFKYTPESPGQEATWDLTAPLSVHMGVFLRNIKALGYNWREKEYTVSIHTDVEETAKHIHYENTNLIDSLTRMAESWDCEWWVVDNVIHFGHCEYDNEHIEISLGFNAENMKSSESKSTFVTRLYVFGSTRNIPANYRPLTDTVVVNGIVQKRLMLPDGTPYIDAEANQSQEQSVEHVLILDEVYPRTECVIDDVSTYEHQVENDDGSTNKETFYRISDKDFPFKSEYALSGEELHVVFQSGKLNGMDFSVQFDEKENQFEIVANENYGRKLPGGTLIPAVGDKFVLYGWDSTKITDLGLVSKAEKELLEKGQKFMAKSKIDPNTYTCPMMSDWVREQSIIKGDEMTLPHTVGTRVTLINDTFFATGKRNSRIIGIEYNLDIPWDTPVYTIGETASYSRIGEIEDKIKSLTLAGETYKAVTNGSGVYLIGLNDPTAPTSRNAYSAVRSRREFLSRLNDDRSKGQIASDKAIEVGNFLAGVSGAKIGVDAETGQTFGEMDRLFIRIKAYFETLTIIEANTLAGKQYITPGGSIKCTKVEETDTGYRCYFLSEQDGEKTETKIIAGDQAISEMFNAKPGTTNKVSNHRYWRLVTGVSNDAYTDDNDNHYGYIELSKTDCETNSDIPKAGDVIEQFGNRTDRTRQGAMVFSTVDADAPSIKLFTGIGGGTTNAEHYSLVNKDIISYGYDPVKGNAYFKCYGDTYLGSRNGNTFVKYDEATDSLDIKAKLTILPSSTIGDKALDDYFKDLIPEIKQEDIESYVNAIVDPKIEGVQNQIDGVIENHFHNGAPTLTNEPWAGWIATDAANGNTNEQERHLGDLYFDNDTGLAYRFSKDANGNYFWRRRTPPTASAGCSPRSLPRTTSTTRGIYGSTPHTARHIKTTYYVLFPTRTRARHLT